MKKGDLVLIPFPFTDLSGTKKRPAVILATSNSDVTVSFITSQMKWKSKFDLVLTPSLKTGLKVTSLLRIDKIATIDKELVIGKLGELPINDLVSVNQALIELFDLNS